MESEETRPTTIEGQGTSSCPVPFSPNVVERIADLYAQNMSLYRISQQAEMPAYQTLLRWVKKHPELREALDAVRTTRALVYEDKALQVAEEACGKDADRIKLEAYRWAAEVNDPARYGKKGVQTTESRPTVIIVQTGFPDLNEHIAPPKLREDGVIEVQGKKVQDDRRSEEVGVSSAGPVSGDGREEGSGDFRDADSDG